MTKTATQRDVTKILNLCDGALNTTDSAVDYRLALADIRVIAKRMDARTGRRDPSVRKASTKSRRSRAAKKSSSQVVRKSAKRKAKA